MAMQQQHQQQSPNHGNMYSTINRFGSTQKSPPPTTLNPTHRVLNSIDNDNWDEDYTGDDSFQIDKDLRRPNKDQDSSNMSSSFDSSSE